MIELVLGGQFGSEGKGSVVQWLVEHNNYDLVIRTGGSQAGHTFCFQGITYKMRMLPCAWHVKTSLAISRQAVVNEEVLLKELQMVASVLGWADMENFPLYIHPSATLLRESNRFLEGEVDLQRRVGSTLEGVGAARANRIMREAPTVFKAYKLQSWIRDYDKFLNPNSRILIESTQGWGLSLFGKHYPFTTSADINPYSILADAGIPFGLHSVKVIGVLRTFPIRVGGNSGYLSEEVTWEELRKTFGEHISDEYTTVTNRRRRVGLFDFPSARSFCEECHPSEVFLTFCDYVCPDLKKVERGEMPMHLLPEFLRRYVALIPNVRYLGVGIGKFLRLID